MTTCNIPIRSFDEVLQLDNLFFFEVAPSPTREVLFGQICIHYTVQLDHVVAEMLKNTPHNAVFPTVDLNAYFAFTSTLDITDRVGFYQAVFKLQAKGNFVKIPLLEILV